MLKKKELFLDKKNIPNFLIIIRLVLTVFIVGLLICKFYKIPGDITIYKIDVLYCSISKYQLLAGLLFILACLSDFLDGFIARKNNWVSSFGKIWDPIADKVLINSVLICFAILNFIPAFIPIIMISRDVIVDANRMLACKQNIDVSANFYGKLKTVLQMLAIIFIYFICCCCFEKLNNTHDHITWWIYQNLLMYIATLMSVFSGSYYLFIKK